MDKHAPPPSYNEVYPVAPSAPPNEHNFPQNAPGWTHQPQYAQQHPQPIAHQPQLVTTHQHQIPIQNVIVINQQMRFGENPVSMICPSCRNQTISKVTYESNFINHILALGCCMLGFWCGCCLIPYCINAIKNVRHDCSKCGAFLGYYRYGSRSG